MYSNISDCDEGPLDFALRCQANHGVHFNLVFNFWEPLHYVLKGYGFQTWEVSPAFAIRSWAYIFLHYPFAMIGSFLTNGKVNNSSRVLRVIDARPATILLYRSRDSCSLLLSMRSAIFPLSGRICQ
jgi:alpha-1,2-mannosyltransferase